MELLQTVAYVGGPDVDARLDLIRLLKPMFQFVALGTSAALESRFAQDDIPYYNYSSDRRASVCRDLKTVAELVRAFRKIRPRIVHTFDTKPAVWGRIAARLAGVPVIIGTVPGLGYLYCDDGLKNRFQRSVYEPLQRAASHCSDLTIFQNKADLDQFARSGIVAREKSLLIPGSGVRPDTYDPQRISIEDRLRFRAEIGAAPDTTVITMVSRLTRAKGVLDFTRAAAEVRRNYPNVLFLLAGPHDTNGPDRLSEEELASVCQNACWIGARKDIPTILANSDLFVFPSAYREGVPRVLLEAASLGLPLVATDIPGSNDVVTDGDNGFLVPIHDTDALASAIVKLVNNPDLRKRFGVRSRARVKERFDIRLIAEQTCQVYTELLTRKGFGRAVKGGLRGNISREITY